MERYQACMGCVNECPVVQQNLLGLFYTLKVHIQPMSPQHQLHYGWNSLYHEVNNWFTSKPNIRSKQTSSYAKFVNNKPKSSVQQSFLTIITGAESYFLLCNCHESPHDNHHLGFHHDIHHLGFHDIHHPDFLYPVSVLYPGSPSSHNLHVLCIHHARIRHAHLDLFHHLVQNLDHALVHDPFQILAG